MMLKVNDDRSFQMAQSVAMMDYQRIGRSPSTILNQFVTINDNGLINCYEKHYQTLSICYGIFALYTVMICKMHVN